MTHLTWGISIPGYSYPSAAQKKLFNKLYPGDPAGPVGEPGDLPWTP